MWKNLSPMRKIFFGMLGFGLMIGSIFPFYANLFVKWIPELKIYFVIGCLIAGGLVGISNYFIMKKVLAYVVNRCYIKIEQTMGDKLVKECNSSIDSLGHLDNIFEQVSAGFHTVDDGAQDIYNIVEAFVDEIKVFKDNSRAIKEEINHITIGSQEQAQKLKEIYRFINTTANTVQGLGVRAKEAVNISDDSINGVNNTKVILENLVMSMFKIEESVNDSFRALENLKNKSFLIEEMANQITEISNQTNLLALNAAIEAARAGENGKGFAVVAGEVRRLAEQSNNTAAQITNLNNEIQQSSIIVVSEMKNSIEEVQTGGAIAKNVTADIDEVVNKINKTSRDIGHIAKDMESIIKDVDNITQRTEVISKIVEESVEATKEVAISADNQDDIVNRINQTLNQVCKKTIEMVDLIRNYIK